MRLTAAHCAAIGAGALAVAAVWAGTRTASGDSRRWQAPGPSIPWWTPAAPPGGVWDGGQFPWRYPYRSDGSSARVVTRHRYPARPGLELSAIIRDGLPGFTAGPPADPAWLAGAPSAAMW